VSPTDLTGRCRSMISRSESRKRKAEAQERDVTEYETVFIEVSNRVERLLRIAVWTGLAALLLAQLLLLSPAVRKWAVKVEKLEGVPFERSYGRNSGS
ncbi:MAG: hypothetical protein K0Q94_451, partial [Paenibacillus sp.]|nr:hypothetical protein [Paenibacillus sp.]